MPQPVPHADQVARAQANTAKAQEAARRGIPEEFLPQHLKTPVEEEKKIPIKKVVSQDRGRGSFVRLSTINLAKQLNSVLLLVETEHGVASCYTTAPAGGRLDPAGGDYEIKFEVMAEDELSQEDGGGFRRLSMANLQAVGGKLLVTESKHGVSVCFANAPV